MLRKLAGVALLLLGLGGALAPPAASAAEPVRLSIAPVGVPGSYFSLTAVPGERSLLTVQLGNAGAAAITARTYSADAYTIVNGGFGARLDGDPTTGATTWLDFPSETLDLPAGARVQRTFVVTVPADAQPGEYLASLVIQNADPVSGAGSQGDVGVAFRQINRQAIAVSITVPGPLVPRLEIGDTAVHRTVAGSSSIEIPVRNTGNVRLTSRGEMLVHDASGKEISRFELRVDSFYAGTETSVEVPFAKRLNPGQYTASLSLSSTAAGIDVKASSLPLPFVVTSEADASLLSAPIGVGTLPKPAAVDQAAPPVFAPQQVLELGPTGWLPLALAASLGALIAGVGIALILRRRPASVAAPVGLLVAALAAGLLGNAVLSPSIVEAAPCLPIAPNQPAQFAGCAYNGQSLVGVDGSGSNFDGATFNGATLTGSNFSGASFVGATFDGAIMTNVNLSQANLTNTTLNGVNFTGANLTGATLTGATTDVNVVWSNTTCPDGTNSGSNGATCEGHLRAPPTSTPTRTATPTSTATVTPSFTATSTPTGTSTPASTSSPAESVSSTPTPSPSPSPDETSTVVAATATATATGAAAGSATPTGSATPASTAAPGARTASVADLALPSAAYSHGATAKLGVISLVAEDAAGSGWRVTIHSSDFAYSGPHGGASIPAGSFSITGDATLTAIAGQPIDAAGGPRPPTVGVPNLTLDSPRTVLLADAGFGVGRYAQSLPVRLLIPPQARAGTYVATLVVDMTAAP